jgi:hypothetical protein
MTFESFLEDEASNGLLLMFADFARGRFPGSRVNAVPLKPSPGVLSPE